MNAYDFDDTIYDGDCSTDFFKYLFSKRPLLVLSSIFSVILWVPLFLLNIKTQRDMKERIFKFVTKLNNIEELIEDFWDLNQHKIKKWYLEQQKEDDLVISASLDFIIKPICFRLNIKNVLATDYDFKTGKIIGLHCHDHKKIKKFEKAFPNKKINKAYSDSFYDAPLLEYAKEGYVVVKDKIYPYEGHVFEKRFIYYLIDLHFLGSILVSIISGLIIFSLSFSLNIFINILYSFSISYFISIYISYIIWINSVYKTKFKIKKIIELFLLSIPNYILLLCSVYLLSNGLDMENITTMLIIIIFYIPSVYLILKLLEDKTEDKKNDY